MKKFISMMLALVMVLSTMAIGVSAASMVPTIYSHDDREAITLSSGDKLTIKFDSVRGVSHYYCYVKTLKNTPTYDDNEPVLNEKYYNFVYDGVWVNQIHVFGYDMEGAKGHWLKIYVEARDAADRYIGHDVIYLFLRKDADDFKSPWDYGHLPMKTVRNGASGTEIKALRQAINIILGEDRLKINDTFDAACELGLKDAQRLLKIDDDGIFGPESRKFFLSYLEKHGHGMENGDYNANPALDYALRYNGTHPGSKYNKAVYSSYSGADCANFVSQCLIAGGLAITSDFNSDLSVWKTCRYNPSNRTAGLMDHLAALGYKIYGYDKFTKNGASATYPVDISKIKSGDIIFSKGANNTISGHVMIVDRVESNTIYYYGHTKDRCGCTSCKNSIGIKSIQSHIAMSEKDD